MSCRVVLLRHPLNFLQTKDSEKCLYILTCWDGSAEALQVILCVKAGLELDHEEGEGSAVLLIGFAETHMPISISIAFRNLYNKVCSAKPSKWTWPHIFRTIRWVEIISHRLVLLASQIDWYVPNWPPLLTVGLRPALLDLDHSIWWHMVMRRGWFCSSEFLQR